MLATDGTRVRGMLLQRMPSAGPEDDATWRRVATAGAFPAPGLLGADSAEALLATRFPDDDIRVNTPRAARFRCDCSSERVGNALRMLGRAEIESILAEQGMVGVTCEFCNRRYSFVAADALALFARASATEALPMRAAPRDTNERLHSRPFRHSRARDDRAARCTIIRSRRS